MKAISITGVTYFSLTDEDIFFKWLESIDCIKGMDGELRTLYLMVDETLLDESALDELWAVFKRYKILLSELKPLNCETSNAWFKKKRLVKH